MTSAVRLFAALLPAAVGFLCVGSLCVGCGGPVAQTTPPPAPVLDTSLGPGDVFDVRVMGEDELSSTFRVSNDGGVDFPFVGELEVAGLEPEEVADLVAVRLREGEFLVDPHVNVFVQEYQSKRVSVVGAVKNPGTFSIAPGLTVVHAIQQAGGASALASQNDTVITRRIEGELRRFRVRVRDITRGQSEDFPLQAGDIIYVPERIF